MPFIILLLAGNTTVLDFLACTNYCELFARIATELASLYILILVLTLLFVQPPELLEFHNEHELLVGGFQIANLFAIVDLGAGWLQHQSLG